MFGENDRLDCQHDRTERAVSVVIGVVLMVALTVIMASIVAGMALSLDERLQEPELQTDAVSPWSDQDTLLAPEDPSAGAEDVRYRVLLEVEDTDMEGDSLNELEVSVNTGDDMFSGTSQGKVETFEIEKTDGTELDLKSELNGWDVRNGGSEVEMQLTGSVYTNPQVGDEIAVILDGVDNPNNPGTYDLSVTLNQDEDEQSGELEIIG